MAQNALLMSIREWLVDQSLEGDDIVEIFETLCERLYAAGIPVVRGRLILPTLHPLFGAETVEWNRGNKAKLNQFEHQDNETDTWKRSPMRHVAEQGIEVFRRELAGENEMSDFEILQDLKDQGMTDYLILATKLQHVSTSLNPIRTSNGVIVTWATDRPTGFSDDDLVSLQKIQRRFAAACKTIIQSRISTNITTTYLGIRAGGKVLDGQIRLGDGEKTKAVVWYSDLRNSTSIAESLPPDVYFSMLNSYFEATAGAVIAHGGEVLDFIGDTVLGIFPYSGDSELCEAANLANQALDQAVVHARDINADREKRGEQQFKFGIGMNVGEVMFGNIGIPQRLSFSVIGPSVNEVVRIEQMTKYLQQPVLAGKKLAELDPHRWKTLGEHKLEGVLDPVELFSFQCRQAA